MEYRIFVGIDPSIRGTGVALMRDDDRVLRTEKLSARVPVKDFPRVITEGTELAGKLIDYIKAHTPDVSLHPIKWPIQVVMEYPPAGRMGSGPLYGIGAVYVMKLLSCGIMPLLKGTQTLQKLTGIKKVDKPDVKRVVLEIIELNKLKVIQSGKEIRPDKLRHDEVDATLYLFYYCYNCGVVKIPEHYNAMNWMF